MRMRLTRLSSIVCCMCEQAALNLEKGTMTFLIAYLLLIQNSKVIVGSKVLTTNVIQYILYRTNMMYGTDAYIMLDLRLLIYLLK